MYSLNFSSVCRTCLNKENLSPIFSDGLDPAKHSEIIFVTTGIKIKLDDGLPQNMCNSCLNKINNTLDFRKQCKEAEEKLLSFKDDIKFDIKIKIEYLKVEIGSNYVYPENLDEDIIDTEVTLVKNELNKKIDEDDKPLKYFVGNLNNKENPLIDIDLTKDSDNSVQNNQEIKTFVCKCVNKVVLKNHTNDKERICNLCENIASDDLLNKHHDSILNNTVDISQSNDTGDQIPEISNVNKKSKKSVLYEFDITDPLNKRVTCKLCQKNLSIRSIDSHMVKSHPGADKTRVKCELCDSYVMKKKFNRHKASIHGTGSFKCRYCKWEFEEKQALINHVGDCPVRKKRKICESSRELRECDLCHKTMQKASLRVHKAIKHAGLRPVCEHCGRSFGNKLRLKEHFRAKHDYAKFKCSYCDFLSSSVTSLKNHERRHRGEKPFECDTCGAKFHAAYLLAQHKQSHATEKQFQCDICPASFKVNNSLHMHKRTCHGSMRYACAVCSRAFNSRSYAVKHMRTVHHYSGPIPPLLVTKS